MEARLKQASDIELLYNSHLTFSIVSLCAVKNFKSLIKGWIICDGKEFCSEGPFKNHVCEDLKGRTLVGATERDNEKSLNINEATMPNIVHKHTQKSHQHTVKTSTSGNHHACKNGDNHCASTDRGGDTYTSSAVAPLIELNAENDDDAHPVNYNYEHSFGDLYSRHMRVDYIFKCF